MIEINKTPPVLAFAGNPMIFKIISDNEFTTVGSKAFLDLFIYAPEVAIGNKFSISFGNYALEFTSAVTPDDSGLQYPAAIPGDTFNTWAVKIHSALSQNYLLQANFDLVVTIDPTEAYASISFTAKQPGSGSSITFDDMTTSFVVDSNDPGIDPVSKDNFAIVASLWDANFQKLAEDIKSLDTGGEVTFDFSEYISTLLDQTAQPRFTFPQLSGTLIKFHSNFTLQYFSSFGEKYGGVIRKLIYDDKRIAISGGLNRETLVHYNQLVTDFFAIADNKKRFLTWAPLSKVTAKAVPEKLFFAIPDKPSYTHIKIVVNITYTDNTTHLFDATPLTAVSDLDVAELMVGHDQLDLGSIHPLLTVKSYIVYLMDQTNVRISEIRTFIIDPQAYEHERIFIFENSFGRAYDVVRFTGKSETNLDMDHNTATVDDGKAFSFYNAPIRKFSTSEGQKMKTNSGWISAEMKDYLREMLLSRKVYEIKNGLLYPIIITNQKVTSLFKDGEYLFSHDIEYDQAYRDFFFQN